MVKIFLLMQDLPKVGLLYEVCKCGQNISTSVGFTKSRAFVYKCGQNCANLLYRNNISRAIGLRPRLIV